MGKRNPGALKEYKVNVSIVGSASRTVLAASKEEAEDGAKYTETANDIDFSDGNTVIYGHNTLDRLEKLHEYQDRTFFDENREVRIYLPEKMLVYRIFAAYP